MARADELGYQSYRSVREIPGPVDYLTITVPNTVVPQILTSVARLPMGWTHGLSIGIPTILPARSTSQRSCTGRVAEQVLEDEPAYATTAHRYGSTLRGLCPASRPCLRGAVTGRRPTLRCCHPSSPRTRGRWPRRGYGRCAESVPINP